MDIESYILHSGLLEINTMKRIFDSNTTTPFYHHYSMNHLLYDT